MSRDDIVVRVNEIFTFEPFLDSYCLAGWSGKDKAVDEIIEIQETEQDLKEGNLWIFNLKTLNPDLLLKYIDYSSAGILLYGDCLFSSTSEIIDRAEKYRVPIIHTTLENAGIEAQYLWVLIHNLKKINKFLHFVRNSIYYHIKEKKQSELLAFLESATNNPTVIVNNMFQVINSSGDILTGDNNTNIVLKAIYDIEKQRFKKVELNKNGKLNYLTLSDNESIGYINNPLYFGGYHYGFMITLELNNPISTVDMIYLEEARKIILEQMVSRRNLEDIEKKYKTDFIHDLLFNNFESKEEVVTRGKHWDFDLSVAHHLFVFEPVNQEKKPEGTIAKIQSVTFELFGGSKYQPIIGQNQNMIVALIPESYLKDKIVDKESIIQVAQKFQGILESCVPAISCNIGIGRFYPSITDLCRSFQEAKLALELGKNMRNETRITHFEDLGVMRLLANIDFFQLHNYYKEYLREILAYDEQNDSNLLETLMMYFRYNGDINVVAHKMFIHANSLRYRLKKIEELTNTDLKNYEDMVNLVIACKIATMYIHSRKDSDTK